MIVAAAALVLGLAGAQSLTAGPAPTPIAIVETVEIVGIVEPVEPVEPVETVQTVPQQPDQPAADSTSSQDGSSQDQKQDQQSDEQKKKADDQKAEAKEPPTPPHTGVHALLKGVVQDFQHLPTVENGYIALTGGGLALAAHQVDQSFNVHLRSHYDLVNTAFAPGKYLGGTPVQVALSLGTFAWGRMFDEPKVSHLGMDLLRGQIVAEGIVEPLKFITRRERPDHSDFQSFPSGHAAATFAGATILERHVGWRKSAVAYVIAAYVSMSRLHDNVHFLSDVAFGAAVGTIAGRTVTQHGRNTWTFAPMQVPGGMAIVVMHTPREQAAQ